MIENLDLALRIKTQLEDYLAQLNYKKALVTIDDSSINSSREFFEKHELHRDKHQFQLHRDKHQFHSGRGYYIYDEDLIVKQLSDSIIDRLVEDLELFLIYKKSSKFELNIRHSSVIDASDVLDGVFSANLWYEIKPYYN